MQMILGDSRSTETILTGSKYRDTYQSAVIGILGSAAPRVVSKGSLFLNHDRWTVRRLIVEMCQWASRNPKCVPQRTDVAQWVRTCNAHVVAPSEREILIANTPEKLHLRTALALTGGAYHEALHTLYSARRDLLLKEVWSIVFPRWPLVPDWSLLTEALLNWSNLIEDIRIERRGREQFEGIFVMLCDLQDFILTMEEQADLQAPKIETLSIIERSFRDFGLGYNTDKGRDAIQKYLRHNADAVELVLDGPLSPYLKESIGLGVKEDVSCLRLAMDVLIKLIQLAGKNQQDQQNKSSGAGDGKTVCPSCGAPGNKIVVRPKASGWSGPIPGKGIATCTVCGYQEEIDISQKPKSESKKSDPSESPVFEGFDNPPKDKKGNPDPAGKSDQKTDASEGEKPKDQDGSGSSGNPDQKEGTTKPDQEGKGSGSAEGQKDSSCSDPNGAKGDKKDPLERGSNSAEGTGEQGSKPNESEGKGASSGDGKDAANPENGKQGSAGTTDPPEESPQNGKGGRKPFDSTGQPDNGQGSSLKEGDKKGAGSNSGQGSSKRSDGDAQGSEKDSEGASTGGGAGGHYYDDQPHEGNDWAQVAGEAIKQGDHDSGILDAATALQQSFNEHLEQNPPQWGEVLWNPYDQTHDVIRVVQPSARGQAWDTAAADAIISSVRSDIAFLRSRLRTVVRSLEQTGVAHGVPRGRNLSNRFLVDTLTSIRAHETPSRPYWVAGDQIDMSMAAAIVIDESGSMVAHKETSTRILTAITDPLDNLGAAVLALGFRDGKVSARQAPAVDHGHYHRNKSVMYEIFKGWNERFHAVRWRFANTRQRGGTPMSDGIQFALLALSARNETHRFLFVVTDGRPDHGHEGVVRRQIRLGKEAGIHIIGVGIGAGTRYITTLFHDSVWSPTAEGFPRLLVAKLNELVDIRARHKGKRIAK
jgi:hypothetical protein